MCASSGGNWVKFYPRRFGMRSVLRSGVSQTVKITTWLNPMKNEHKVLSRGEREGEKEMVFDARLLSQEEVRKRIFL